MEKNAWRQETLQVSVACTEFDLQGRIRTFKCTVTWQRADGDGRHEVHTLFYLEAVLSTN
ncbi:hypothetical protein DPMN_186944 [Dreissena polymorpha]|uniref:Uncharacterized protein n=1 Tax=Dreissena polymorpha TaxID=45954 RepID=A0A9D4DNR8_DREPO|nr:hypothetical protein DPMN_186944 [Dreissena polymorpha]